MASEISRGDTVPFIWRSAARGWCLIDAPGLSVVEGEMPPGQAADLREHRRAQQFFYVLEGDGGRGEGRRRLVGCLGHCSCSHAAAPHWGRCRPAPGRRLGPW